MFDDHTHAFVMCFKPILHMADLMARRQESACREVAFSPGLLFGDGSYLLLN